MHDSLKTHEFLAQRSTVDDYQEVEARLKQIATWYGFEITRSMPDLEFVRGDENTVRSNIRFWPSHLSMTMERESSEAWRVELKLTVKNAYAAMSSADLQFLQDELNDMLGYTCAGEWPTLDRAAQAQWAAKMGVRMSIGAHSLWAAAVLVIGSLFTWIAAVASAIALYPIMVWLMAKVDLPYPSFPLRERPE